MKTLAFGETLWDIFGDEACIGGASLNMAAHLAKLGADSSLISAVGRDGLGEAALKAIKGFGVKTDFIPALEGRKTGTVTVTLGAGGSPSYEIHKGVAWDCIELDGPALEKISSGDWDYFAFGTLAQRSETNRKSLEAALEALPYGTAIVYDVNLRQDFHKPEWIKRSLDRCNILKLNEDEAEVFSQAFFNVSLPLKELASRLADKHSLDLVCITLGGKGAGVLSRSGGWTQIPAARVEVADTVGAGDSFTASLIFALRHGWSPEDSAKFAAKVGGFVASKRGAVPEYSKELLTEIRKIRKGPAA